MNKTKNTILLALLVLQAGLIAFLYRPGQNAVPAAANLFKSLTPEQVTSLAITSEQGKSITLVKKDGWQISQSEFPADAAKIDGLLKKLAGLKTSRLVSQTTSSHARLKVAEGAFNRKVELGQGESKSTFFLGTSPSAKSIHLRLSDAKEVYQINDLAAWEMAVEPESWLKTRYLGHLSTDLNGLTITNGHGTIELVNDTAKKAWQLKDSGDRAIDAKQVEALVNSLMDITIDSYLAKDITPKGKPLATVSYQGKDGAKTLEVWGKEKPEDGNQVIKSSASAFYAKAKDYVVKGLLEAKIDTLLAKPDSGATGGETVTTPPAAAGGPGEETPAAVTAPPGR